VQDLRIGESLPEDLAQLHSANIRTWKHEKVALGLFDRAEIRELGNALEKLASRPESSGNVLNRARQIVAWPIDRSHPCSLNHSSIASRSAG
jgi:hypothetical protein